MLQRKQLTQLKRLY